jgi:hypothetical protein
VQHIYRRPFDFPQHRQAFNVWAMAGLTEGNLGTLTSATYAATVTSSAGTGTQYSRSVRYSAQGIYRPRWPHAEKRSKIYLIYTDADAIDAARPVAGFTASRATVQLGSNPGAGIGADDASAAFTTFDAAIEAGRRDPFEVGRAFFAGQAATVTGTAGLGQSREGATQAKSSGTYTPGSTRAGRKRVASLTNRITRAK